MIYSANDAFAFKSGDPNAVPVEQLAFAIRYWNLRGVVHGHNWLTEMLTPPAPGPRLGAALEAAPAADGKTLWRAQLGNEFRVVFVRNPEDSTELIEAVSTAFKIPVTACTFNELDTVAQVRAVGWNPKPLVDAARTRATELKHIDKFNELSDIEQLQLGISLAAM